MCIRPYALDRHVLSAAVGAYLLPQSRRAVEHTLCYCAVLFLIDWPPLAMAKGPLPLTLPDGDASHLHDTGHAIATRITRRRCSHASVGYILNEVHAHGVVRKGFKRRAPSCKCRKILLCVHQQLLSFLHLTIATLLPHQVRHDSASSLATAIPFASTHIHNEAFSRHSHLPHRLSPCDMGHRWW